MPTDVVAYAHVESQIDTIYTRKPLRYKIGIRLHIDIRQVSSVWWCMLTSTEHHEVRVPRVDVITTNRLSTFVNSTVAHGKYHAATGSQTHRLFDQSARILF